MQTLRPVVGSSPVILCGSRATGEASISSDYDLFVLLKPARIPFAIPRLRRVAQRLEQRLGADVSLNPLPRFRLEHPGRTLLVWKIRQEGKVLWPSEGFELPPACEPALSAEAASSYALSGLRFLIAELRPGDLSHEPLGAELRHAVRKALLHASQLTLIRSGRYASGLRDAIELLERTGASEYSELARSIDRTETWLRVRDLLSAYVSEHREPVTRSFVANGQYVALSEVGLFRMFRPGVTVTTSTGTVSLDTNMLGQGVKAFLDCTMVIRVGAAERLESHFPRSLRCPPRSITFSGNLNGFKQ